MLKTATPRASRRGRGGISRAVPLLAAGLGVLVSLAIRDAGGVDGWILALLVLSAAVAAIAQQTLP